MLVELLQNGNYDDYCIDVEYLDEFLKQECVHPREVNTIEKLIKRAKKKAEKRKKEEKGGQMQKIANYLGDHLNVADKLRGIPAIQKILKPTSSGGSRSYKKQKKIETKNIF